MGLNSKMLEESDEIIKSKYLGSNASAVKSLFFLQKDFQIL